MPQLGRVLIVAGSDSGGGAGIQADIKTVTALGGYAATAITALTAQNTQGVHGIFEVSPDFIQHQMRVVLDDIGADVIKTGMLHKPAVIEAVADVLDDSTIPLVLDPVMVAKGGHALLETDAMGALKSRLLPRAAVLTPNIPEAISLTGREVSNPEHAGDCAKALADLGARTVLLKGGHMDGDTLTDALWVDGELVDVWSGPRLDTRHTHGTGCTTASAIACGLAQGLDIQAAVERARAYVFKAIETAPGFGSGHGPLNHGHPFSMI